MSQEDQRTTNLDLPSKTLQGKIRPEHAFVGEWSNPSVWWYSTTSSDRKHLFPSIHERKTNIHFIPSRGC